MLVSKKRPELIVQSQALLTASAWVITLLASSLIDILCFELIGTVPSWVLVTKVSLLGVLLLLSWLWRPINPLFPFVVMLLAITSLMRANTLLLGSSAWLAWQNQQSFALAGIAAQLLELGVALFMIGLLFLLRKHRQRFFLVRGAMQADIEPLKLLGQKSPSPLWRFGLVFTLVVIVVQCFMFILPLTPTSGTIRHLMRFVPVILLLAAFNSFTEEIIFRATPISTLYEVVGKPNAIGMAAVLFGLAHYIGGIPSGVPGVLITTFLGWFFGKCMLDSKGLFWPWLFHTLQDILPFSLMALAVIS